MSEAIYVVVLGDVHGNARALRAALDRARSGPMDRMVFLGDLLTYGHDVDEVIELVGEAQERDGAALLIGNHDQMYFDLLDGRRTYFSKLPEWLKETVEYTATHLDRSRFREGLRWSEEHILDRVLFAHANPFGFGNWTYLNRPEDRGRAERILGKRGLDVGVFGHTHRARWGDAIGDGGVEIQSSRRRPIVANAGSVGQPRDARAESVLLRLKLTADAVTASFERVVYDVAAHVAALQSAFLSEGTRERLSSYFVPRSDSLRDS